MQILYHSDSATFRASLAGTGWPQPSPGRHLAFGAVWLLTVSVPFGDMFSLPTEIPISRVLTILAFVIWLAAGRTGSRGKTVASALVAMYLYIAWAAATSAWTLNPYRSTRRLLSYVDLFLLVWLVCAVSVRQSDHRRLLQGFVYGCWVLLFGIARNYRAGVSSGDFRYTPTGLDANDAANTLALGVLVAWYLISVGEGKKLLNWAYVLSAVAGVLLTGSRSGLISLGIGMLFAVLHVWHKHASRSTRALLVLSVCGGAYLAPTLWHYVTSGRLATIGRQLDTRDLNGRVQTWRAGIDVFLTAPTVGVGPGSFSTSIEGLRGSALAAHDAFLEVAVEHGLIGLVLFAAIMLTLIQCICQMPPVDSRFWSVVLGCWTVTALTLSWENREISWLMFGLLAAASSLKPSPYREAPRTWFRSRIRLTSASPDGNVNTRRHPGRTRGEP